MMNKGLEVIEAHHLFGMSLIKLMLWCTHSICHSFVETIDGAIFSHMGKPDMRYPIQYAMSYPDRFDTPFKQKHLTQMSGLTFFEPNSEAFPLLPIECGKKGCIPLYLTQPMKCLFNYFWMNEFCF